MSSKPNLAVAADRIEFIDLAAQQRRIKSKIDAAIAKVLAHGGYIMGPEVAEFEKQLSAFCGATYSLSCSNGTDALALVLIAKRVKPRDAVFCPSFTFAATAEVVAWLGATPIFIDNDPVTFNMCPQSLKQGIAKARELGLNPVGIIPVDLFGQPADYDAILPLTEENKLWVMCDSAQGFGGVYKGRKVGTIGDVTTTSFFPARPLGCYGDGGAVFTEDKALYDTMVSLRVHGKGEDKYDNVRIGMNGRLDTLQAAILIEKLAIFADEIVERQRVADRYNEGLGDIITTPQVLDGCSSVWAQYTLVAKDAADRARLQNGLKDLGIPTAVYYPKPLHQQTAYKNYPTATGGALATCEDQSQRVFSLPMHPYLENATIDRIVDAVRGLLK